MRAPCPCGQKKVYMQCCRRLLSGRDTAQTALALMRSRYTAHVKHDSAYLMKTCAGDAAKSAENTPLIDPQVHWVRLEIHQVVQGQANDQYGEVEFTAYYHHECHPHPVRKCHEHSVFKKQGERWFYTGCLSENTQATK